MIQLLQITNFDKVFDNYITLPRVNLHNRGGQLCTTIL